LEKVFPKRRPPNPDLDKFEQKTFSSQFHGLLVQRLQSFQNHRPHAENLLAGPMLTHLPVQSRAMKILLSVLIAAASMTITEAQAGDFSISFYGGSPGLYAPPAYYAPAPYYYGRPAYYAVPVSPYGYGYRSGYGPSHYSAPRGGVGFGSDFGGSYFYYSSPRHR
jgi:hypothetical protein